MKEGSSKKDYSWLFLFKMNLGYEWPKFIKMLVVDLCHAQKI